MTAALRRWFGPSKDDIWRQLADAIGGRVVDGGFWSGDRVEATHGEWTVTLDTYTVSSGQYSHVTYTRMRAPFVNQLGFRFTVYREGIFSDLAKRFGMQDIQIGIAPFDEGFIV
jgi:hypothetical protein